MKIHWNGVGEKFHNFVDCVDSVYRLPRSWNFKSIHVLHVAEMQMPLVRLLAK